MIRKIADTYIKSFSGLSREVWLLAVVMLINRSGMMVLPFITLYVSDELEMGIIRAGYIASAFGVGSLTGSLLGGYLSDRIGTYKVILMALVLGGIGFMVLSQISGFYGLLIGTFLVVTITDAARPATMTAVALYSTEEAKTRSISLIRLAINLGISIGPAVAGLLASSVGYFWLFMGDGLTCILAGVFFWIMLSPKNVKTKAATLKSAENDTPQESVYRDGYFILYLFLFMIGLISFFQILSTAPLFLENELGLTKTQIGLFFTANGLLIFLFEMPIVYTLERIKNAMLWVVVGGVMIAASYYILSILGPVWLIVTLYTLLISFGEILNFPFSNAIALSRGKGKKLGQFMGLYSMTFSLSLILAPIIGTYLIEHSSYKMAWKVLSVISMVSMIGLYFMRHKVNQEAIIDS